MSYSASAGWYLIVLGGAAFFTFFAVWFYRRGSVIGALIGTAGCLTGLLVGVPSLAASRVTVSEGILEIRRGPWYDQRIERLELTSMASIKIVKVNVRGKGGRHGHELHVAVTLTDGSMRTFPRTMVWESNEKRIFQELQRRGIQAPA